MRVGDLLMPLVAVMGRELVRGNYIQADETPVDVQTRDGRSRNHPGYLWQYGTPGGAAIFEFRMGRGREGPMRFLEDFAGILQTDAYAAYDRVGGPKMVHAACWAHSRRRFVEATKLNQQDVASTRIIAQVAELFAIDAQARDHSMDHTARHMLRKERAPLVLAELKAQIEAASRNGTPFESTRQGIFLHPSAVGQTHALPRLSSVGTEQQPRGELHAPGGDWPSQLDHIGHEKAGPRVAAILSIVETCRRLKIPVREYLAAVLPRLANSSIQRLPELTPTAWAASNL
jgi:transposase